MKNKELIITVAGCTGTGKSIVSFQIQKALTDLGYENVEVIDIDGLTSAEGIVLMNKPKITIKQQQLIRNPDSI